MKIKIRQASKDDLQAVSKIAIKCFPQDYISSSQKIKKDDIALQWIEKHFNLNPFGLVIIAENESKAIGFIMYFMIGGLSGVVHIEQVGVDPDFQRQGIGLQMMKEGEEILKKHMTENLDTNLTKLVLTTSSENPASHDLYKKQGYNFVANLGQLFFSGDEIMYEKVVK